MGWGSICGSLIPAINFLGHVLEPADAEPLIEELMAWYQETPFPLYQPEGEVPTTVAGSTLCHASVTKWCLETGENAKSPLKKQRCGGLTADVVAKTIDMIDKHLAGSFDRAFKPAAIVGECKTCHGSEPIMVTGKESCTNCHDDAYTSFPHPSK